MVSLETVFTIPQLQIQIGAEVIMEVKAEVKVRKDNSSTSKIPEPLETFPGGREMNRYGQLRKKTMLNFPLSYGEGMIITFEMF